MTQYYYNEGSNPLSLLVDLNDCAILNEYSINDRQVKIYAQSVQNTYLRKTEDCSSQIYWKVSRK